MIRKFFKWLFKAELNQLESRILEAKAATNKVEMMERHFNKMLSNIDVSVDVHEHHRYARSWAVISLQGSRTDYLKFIDLGDSDIRHIAQFLRQFERGSNIKIDASPSATGFLRMPRARY